MSRYTEPLPAFVDRFGDGLFVGTTEELAADPDGLGGRLLDCLGLPATPPMRLRATVNAGGTVRNRALGRAMVLARETPGVKRAVRDIVPARARERVRTFNGRAEPPPPEVAELRSDLDDQVRYVEDLLGRRIDVWHGGDGALRTTPKGAGPPRAETDP